jgi:ribonuclease D
VRSLLSKGKRVLLDAWRRRSSAVSIKNPAGDAGPQVSANRKPASGRSITREEINALPLYRYSGPVHVVAAPDQVEAAVAALRRERVLGFDTETRASFHKGESYPPAVVQLAASDAVYLFQLRKLPNRQWFKGLLGNPAIIKAGVSIARDIKELRELHAFEPAGFVELAKLSDQAGIACNGLRGLAAVVLGCRISKSAQRSNWAQTDLTPAQITYAATDAWICRKLFLRIEEAIARSSR